MLDKTKLVGEEFFQGKNDYKSDGMFCGLFLAPKIKNCSNINKFGIVREHKTLKGFNKSKRFLDRFQYFKMIEVKNLSTMLPKSWKKSFKSGVVIPTRMIFCTECTKEKLCNKCNNQVNGNKDFQTNLKELRRPPHNHVVICFLIINYKLY